MRKIGVNDRCTTILRHQESVPVVKCGWYDNRTVYFWCSECKRYHYHRPIPHFHGHCCGSGLFVNGYIIEFEPRSFLTAWQK